MALIKYYRDNKWNTVDIAATSISPDLTVNSSQIILDQFNTTTTGDPANGDTLSVVVSKLVNASSTVDLSGYLTKTDAASTYVAQTGYVAFSQDEKTKLAGLNNYTLPAATDKVLGGVKIGTGINKADDGTISITPTDLSAYYTKTDIDTKISTINTQITAINNKFGTDGKVEPESLPIATKTDLGSIIVGDNLTVDATGKVSAAAPVDISGLLSKPDAANTYVAKVDGKDLSSNDFTDTYKSALDNLGTTYIATNTKAQANGVASLDENGHVPIAQLPSYVDDVVEAENKAALPQTGETGKIYITIDDNRSWRWSGTQYINITSGGTADQAVADSDGNNIVNTYLKKTDAETTYLKKSDYTTYTLPAATDSVLGGIKGGAGTSLSDDGTLSVDFSNYYNKTEVENKITPITTQINNINNKFGDDDKVKPTSLPIATGTTLGGIIVGNGLAIEETTGKLSATGTSVDLTPYLTKVDAASTYLAQADYTPYTLPIATPDSLGGFILGDGLVMTNAGKLSTTKDPLFTTTEIDECFAAAQATLVDAETKKY